MIVISLPPDGKINTIMETMKFVTGRVEFTRPKLSNPQDEAEELLAAVLNDRESLTRAVDSLLKSKGYKVSKIIHDNGRIFADVSSGNVPNYKPLKTPVKKSMKKGWTRGFVGFTSTLKQVLSEMRKQGRHSIKFDELYREVMDIFKDRQGKRYRAMEREKFAGYLHDKRYFPTVKYNSIDKLVKF
jgi:hypothetical protein